MTYTKNNLFFDLSNILDLNNKQKDKIKKLKLHQILSSSIIVEKLNLNKEQKIKYTSFINAHKHLEILLSIEENQKLNEPEQVLKVLAPYMSSLKVEEMVAIYLNDKREVLNIKVIGRGSSSSVAASPSLVFKEGLNIGATGVILAHNHPSQSEGFSENDFKMTEIVETLGDYLNLILVDHLLYTSKGIISYAEESIL